MGDGLTIDALLRALSASASIDVQIHAPDGPLLRGPPRARALAADDLRRALAGETVRGVERTVFTVEREGGGKLVCAVFQPQRSPSGQRSLADVSALFAKIRDRELTVQTIASLAVPDLADACILDVVEPHGAIRQREIAARDEGTRALLRDLRDHGPDPSTRLPAAIALRSARPVLVPEVTEDALAQWTDDPAHLAALRELAPKSTVAAPLVVRGQVIGALTLHRVTHQPFTVIDLAVVDEIARFASLALENAMLFEALDHAHAEAARARDRFFQILMEAPFAISVREGPDFRLRFANARHAELTRRAQDTGRALEETAPDDEKLRAAFDRALRTGEMYADREYLVRIPGDDGVVRERVLDLKVQPLRGAHDRIEGVLAFASDVTAQVRARLEIETLAKNLDAQQRWLQAILDTVPVPIVLVDAITRDVTHANVAAIRVTGGVLAPGATARRFEDFPTFDMSGHRLPLAALPSARAARGERVDSMQFDMSTPEGRKTLLVSAVLMPAQVDRPPTVVTAFEDITTLKRIESELQKAVRVRDEFLSIASHELKTPLTALRPQVQGLLRAARGTDESRFSADRALPRLDSIDRNVDRLAALIDKLLSIPRIASGQLTIDREPFDLAELVDEVTARFADEIARVSGSMTSSITRPLRGNWDRLRLDQVLTNLLANAVKYGRNGPIHVALEDAGDAAVLAVRDRGIGIAPADQARIFERFERAVSERNYGGFGLGLYITRHIVEAHGGSISVESAPGEGATFIVRLPKG